LHKTNKKYLKKILTTIGLILILIAILIDATYSHGQSQLQFSEYISLQQATKYQLLHGFLLLVLPIDRANSLAIKLIISGVFTFSISIQISLITMLDIGFLTPIGGGIMIIGWLLYLYRLLRERS
jgi:uncharacterized membrane protein YgdD (TMEM256/DUF423 family)